MPVRIADFNTAEIGLTRLNRPAGTRQIITVFTSVFYQTTIPGSEPGDCCLISRFVRGVELAG
jgi:hypothetical protein